MLSSTEQEIVLTDFPNIKLSYENIVYKKVYNSDIILAIPEGKKCFAWFTTLHDQNVCLIMEIADNKQIANIRITNACFSNELAYGTILYGTLFYHKNNRFFAIEDIFCYKGNTIERENWRSKFTTLNTLLKKDLKQVAYNSSFIVFGLPLLSNNIDDISNKIKGVSYIINSIQFRSYNRVNNYYVITHKNFIENKNNNINNNLNYTKTNTRIDTKYEKPIVKPYEKQYEKPSENKYEKPINRNILKNEVVFKIKPDIQNDIYHLYCLNDKMQDEYYSIAHIPDYNTSVFMNNLFRNIKENKNLDALEESDDEEEFENENENKFVYLEREFNILCSYNYKFKKWVPNKLADPKARIILQKDLPNIEKK